MTVKIGLNGFGRIGRLALRRIDELDSKDIEVSAINDLTTPAMLAYLLKHDSMHGKFNGTVTATDDAIVVNGKRIPVYAERDAKNIPWVKNDDVELVLECTGFYTSKEKAQAHLDAGAKRVLISAPAGDVTTIVPKVNMDSLRPDDKIVSAGSCTTNCLAPMAYWLNKDFGIKVGTMTTVHAYTASQAIQDGPRSPKLQDDRAAGVNTVPHSSGAAKAIGLVIPELDGALKGHAQRVAVADGSLTELVSIMDKKVTADEVNEALKGHANEAFGYTDDYMVSTDVLDDPHGSVFDPGQTEITEANGVQLLKTVAWYDNEWGFTCNMVRTLQEFAKFL